DEEPDPHLPRPPRGGAARPPRRPGRRQARALPRARGAAARRRRSPEDPRAAPRRAAEDRLAATARPSARLRQSGVTETEARDTVGAVAVDASGRVAAAVSTGGLWLKTPGRVGDSAVVGGGLYASDG